jgi:predicted transposase/invertase (TIGR01784 family)
MVFVQYPELLKRLVSELLGIRLESISRFEITNPEMSPESVGEKFCRLDINMKVGDRRVDLEIQVANEGDYPERSLYYWAREYSAALGDGGDYLELPPTIVVSIVAFRLFDCEEYHSQYQPLEATRHTPLTDRQALHYFELPKIPETINPDDALELWLTLFRAKTEEELREIEELGVPIMEQAIRAYRHVTATDEFREIERLRSLARHNEAAALRHAAQVERQKWQGVVADKDAVIAGKDAAIADKDALIAELKARLGEDM